MEDDAIFHKEFVSLINKYLQTPPKNILLLSYTHGEDYQKSLGIHTGFNKIASLTGGAMGYVISKEYANKVLTLFDHPGINFLEPNRFTSEVITVYSESCFINPPLILEEAVSSVIGHSVELHLTWFKNYCNLKDYLIPTEDKSIIQKFTELSEKK